MKTETVFNELKSKMVELGLSPLARIEIMQIVGDMLIKQIREDNEIAKEILTGSTNQQLIKH